MTTPTEIINRAIEALVLSRSLFDTLNFNSEGEYEHALTDIDQALTDLRRLEFVDVELMIYEGNGPGIREGWNSAMTHLTQTNRAIVAVRGE